MIRRFFLPALAILTLVLFSLPAVALTSDAPILRLDETSLMYFEADPSLGIDTISSPAFEARFTPTAGRMIWTGRSAPATWLKVTIKASDLGPGYGKDAESTLARPQWLFVVRPSFSIILDDVALYIPRAGGGFDEIHSGAQTPMPREEIRSRYFAFALPPGAFDGNPCYLRISSRTDVLVGFDLETATGFAQREMLNYLAYGIIYGILIALVLYSFFLLVSLKDLTYFYYIVYTVAVGIWLFFLQGHAKFAFGQHPYLDQSMLWFWVGATITWGAVFTWSFLRLRDGRPYLLYAFVAVAALGGVVSLCGLVGWDRMAFSLSHFLGVVLPVLVIAAAAIRLVQGLPSALYFLIAWSFLAVGGFVFALMGLKALPVNFWTTNSVAVGTVIESILLAMALADRFRRIEAEREKLEKIEAHYRELSQNDQLTGLHNKRFLTQELDLAAAKSRETAIPLSILFLDIDNFKNVNDLFGHEAGDEVLITLARSVRSCTRESDRSCRFGGDEFAVIMPGAPGKDAVNVAERIRVRFERESAREIDSANLTATVSIGIAEYDGAESAEAFLARADDAMYEAKRTGKNRSFMR